MGWSDEMSGQAAATFRESVTRDTLLEFWRQSKDWNVTNLLDQVVAPTLLVQEKADKQIASGCRARARYHDPRCPRGYPGRRVAPGEVRPGGDGNTSVPA